MNVGADDYITKPFNPLEVSARVRSQLRRYLKLGSGIAEVDTYTMGGIEMKDSSKEVTVDGLAPFMAAIGGITPIGVPGDELQPDAQMLSEWDAYRTANGSSMEAQEPEPEEDLFTMATRKTLLERIRTEEEWAAPTVGKDGFAVDSGRWEMAMTFIHNHDNLLLTGPSGTGKTELVMW